MGRRAARKANTEARSAQVPISRSDNHRDERRPAPPELCLGGGGAGHRAVARLGLAVLRLLVVRAADARRPALERAGADGRIQRRAGDVGRGVVRRRCGHRPRPWPCGAEWRGRARRARARGLGRGARTVDVVCGVGRARRGDGDDAVRPGVHRADQAVSAALPPGHHRTHAGRRLCEHAVVPGSGVAAALARLARRVAGAGGHAAGGGAAVARLGAARTRAGCGAVARWPGCRQHARRGAAPSHVLAAGTARSRSTRSPRPRCGPT